MQRSGVPVGAGAHGGAGGTHSCAVCGEGGQ